MKQNIGVVLVATVVVLVVLSLSMFVVDQRQNAIVFRFGEIVSIKKAPGLLVKLRLIDNVRFFDVRVLTIESSEPERFLTSEKKNVLVDLFVKWRIAEVEKYYISVNGEESRAQTRLLQTINDGLRAEFGNRTVHDVESEKIRADADRQREVTLAQAYREAERIKGDGDAKAAAIYARAYEQNPEFYAFYRSLEAYKQSFRNKSDVLVLEPNSEFFKYFKNSKPSK